MQTCTCNISTVKACSSQAGPHPGVCCTSASGMAIPVDNAPALPHALGFFNDAPSSSASVPLTIYPSLLPLVSFFHLHIVINLPSQQPLVCRTYLYLPLSAPWPLQSNTSETIFKSATTPGLLHQPRTHSRIPARTRSIAKGKSRGPPGQRIRWDRLPSPGQVHCPFGLALTSQLPTTPGPRLSQSPLWTLPPSSHSLLKCRQGTKSPRPRLSRFRTITVAAS